MPAYPVLGIRSDAPSAIQSAALKRQMKGGTITGTSSPVRSIDYHADLNGLPQRQLAKITTATSLLGLALGFSALGVLIFVKGDGGGASLTGGILDILLGAGFLIAAYLYWRRYSRGYRRELVPTLPQPLPTGPHGPGRCDHTFRCASQ